MQFFYLIISIVFGRKNPLFFLIFPLALLQGPGAFIDTRTVLVAPEYFLLGKNIYKDIIFFYLLGVVIYLCKRVKSELIWKTPMIWYTLYIFILSLITIFSYGTNFEAIAVIRIFIYMPLGYYLILLIFTSSNNSNFTNFFNFLLILNIIQSVLYILNSSKIYPIFDLSFTYREIESGMEVFNRDFLTIPLFSNFLFIFAFAEILTKSYKIKKIVLYTILATYPIVLLYTFTRSLLIITVLELIVTISIIATYKPSKIFKPQLIAIICGFILLLTLSKSVFEKEFNYFNERVEEAKKEGKKDQNLDLRITYHIKALDLLIEENSLLKGQALNKKLDPKMNSIGAWIADSTIPFILIYTGVIGVIIFYLNQLYFILQSKKMKFHFLNSLAITMFSSIFISMLSSFIMGGQPWGSPFIFMYFAIITYMVNTDLSQNKMVKIK